MDLYKIRRNNACCTIFNQQNIPIPNRTVILVETESIHSPKLAQLTAFSNWGMTDDLFGIVAIRVERQLVLVIRP